MIKIISKEEYEAMWNDAKERMIVNASMFPSYKMKGITVGGHSGEGTPFKDEYDRMIYELHNPKMPMYIGMWTDEGLIHYYPDTQFNRKMKEEREDYDE